MLFDIAIPRPWTVLVSGVLGNSLDGVKGFIICSDIGGNVGAGAGAGAGGGCMVVLTTGRGIGGGGAVVVCKDVSTGGGGGGFVLRLLSEYGTYRIISSPLL